jgi:hypothetical protein
MTYDLYNVGFCGASFGPSGATLPPRRLPAAGPVAMRPVEAALLDAAPQPTAAPVSCRKLARLAGGRALEAQRVALEAYCKQAGATIIAWCTEGDSGKLEDRPE